MRRKPEIIKRATVAASKIFHIEEVHLQFSNGNQRIFEKMVSNRCGAVLIVPILDDNTLLLVREYATGTDRYELGFPKGLIDIGETPEQAVNRELQEEVGYAARQIEFLRIMTAAPGYWDGRTHIFLARGLHPSVLIGDEPEPLEIVPWHLDNYQTLLEEENFSEARSIAALFLVRNRLQNER